MPKPDELFVYEREPDPAWQADLDRIAPPGGTVNWLKIHWFPGEPYEPVQRWAIWEIVAQSEYVPPEIMADLRGPDPKVDGQWFWDDEINQNRWFSNSLVSQIQWKIYRETERASQLTWIIQGSKGGHVWKLQESDRAVLREFREDADTVDTPCPGDLPYADYDHRVSSQLAERDRLRQWHQAVAWDGRSYDKNKAGLYVRAERHESGKQYRMNLMKWLDAQIEDAVQDLSRVNLPAASDFQGSKPAYVDLDKIEEEFVEDTGTLVTSEAG